MTRSQRADLLWLGLALVVTAATLVAFQPPSLEHWDEVQIELGMRRWDLAFHQPHPPGYVLFVLAGRLVGALTHVAHPGRLLSLVAVLVWITFIARSLPEGAFRRAVPFAVPILVLLSPTLLVHTTTGRTYLVESTLWVSILLLSMRRDRWTAVALGLLIGLGGGFRPTVLVWGLVLAPIWLMRTKAPRRSWFELSTAMAAGTLVWVAAVAVLCQGLSRYRELSAPLMSRKVLARSVLYSGVGPMLSERLPAMLKQTWDALGPMLVVTATLLVLRIRRRAHADLDPLLFGSLLSFAFYLATIFDSDGYAISYALPLLTWTLLVSARVLEGARKSWVGLGFVVLCAAWAVSPGGLAAPDGTLFSRARLRSIREARMEVIDRFPAETTLATTGVERFWGFSFRSLMAERPALGVLQLEPDPYVAGTDAAHPYLFARNLVTTATDGVDISTLYPSERPLRAVLFTVPKETAARVSHSCITRAKMLQTTRGDQLVLIEVTPALRVHVTQGMLQCDAR